MLTDTIQGTVMIFGTIVLLVGVIYHLGGVESAVNKLTEIDPSLVSPYGPNEMLDFQFMASFLDPSLFRCGRFTTYSRALHGFQRQ